MLYRLTRALAVPALVATAGLTVPSLLDAQVSATRRMSSTALQLGALTRERAFHWVAAAPVIHCRPAPLTERPGVAEEVARPRVAPLEATFFDAAIAKRRVAGVNRVPVP